MSAAGASAGDRQESSAGNGEHDEKTPPGVYYVDPQGQAHAIPPGVHRIQPDGQVGPAIDWQPLLQQIKWEELTSLIENWQKRGSGERLLDLKGMYIVVGMVVLAAVVLGAIGVIGGEAIAGFLGAAIGYLLSRASAGGSE